MKNGYILKLQIKKIIYDSSEFQFWGSELYLKDLPLFSDNKNKSIFSEIEMKSFKSRAFILNQEGRGD